ncbi:O-methyltransferase 3 [Diplonema papillatum]|nr:O-methyltransferase 3 [Diplonema papillatum]
MAAAAPATRRGQRYLDPADVTLHCTDFTFADLADELRASGALLRFHEAAEAAADPSAAWTPAPAGRPDKPPRKGKRKDPAERAAPQRRCKMACREPASSDPSAASSETPCESAEGPAAGDSSGVARLGDASPVQGATSDATCQGHAPSEDSARKTAPQSRSEMAGREPASNDLSAESSETPCESAEGPAAGDSSGVAKLGDASPMQGTTSDATCQVHAPREPASNDPSTESSETPCESHAPPAAGDSSGVARLGDASPVQGATGDAACRHGVEDAASEGPPRGKAAPLLRGDEEEWDRHYRVHRERFFPIKNYVVKAFPLLLTALERAPRARAHPAATAAAEGRPPQPQPGSKHPPGRNQAAVACCSPQPQPGSEESEPGAREHPPGRNQAAVACRSPQPGSEESAAARQPRSGVPACRPDTSSTGGGGGAVAGEEAAPEQSSTATRGGCSVGSRAGGGASSAPNNELSASNNRERSVDTLAVEPSTSGHETGDGTVCDVNASRVPELRSSPPSNQDSISSKEVETREKCEENGMLSGNQATRTIAELSILECGSGTGSAVLPLVKLFSESVKYCAFDISKTAIEQLNDHALFKGNPLASAVVWDCTQAAGMPPELAGSKFDFILLLFVLSAVPVSRMAATLSNLCALLKPGGSILFRDYGLYDHSQLRFHDKHLADTHEPCVFAVESGERHDKQLFYRRGDGTQAYYFSVEEAARLCEGVGLTPSSLEYHCNKVVNRKNGTEMKKVFVNGVFTKP